MRSLIEDSREKISNSLSSLYTTNSKCSKPKTPHLNTIPNADEDTRSQ